MEIEKLNKLLIEGYIAISEEDKIIKSRMGRNYPGRVGLEWLIIKMKNIKN